ncbi:sulfite exporter TauE/SafE family protein [Halobacterium rubrum]|uniref:sulfite exporter TauE/SafE family protein n=1 Tax=Halobacterium TaxID=2239 RepID=UPI001F1CBC25|nr:MULTISPECIES: sulfite exporter TauE/SafE family protein [Halobacterium]MDH5020311.1 sulfite exporter TauE/SafE family protein [Halobacterium rubrum]
MISALGWPTLALLTLVIVIAGATNGLAGFGFALVGTMALATTIDPATAVVFMIVPILAVNLSLVGDLSGDELRTCSRRFAPLVGAALVGTVVGMIALNSIPSSPLRVGLGVLTLGFVATTQQRIPLPQWSSGNAGAVSRTRLGMVGVGSVSGLLFGGTNVGVQLIAYLRSFDLSHGLFVGVVALVFLGLNGIRVVVAGVLGLYPSSAVLGASIAAALPAVVGVAVGKRLRTIASERSRRLVVLGLLTVVGVRLVGGGLGLL